MSKTCFWCQRLKKKQEHRDSAAEIVDSEQSFDNGMKFGQLSMSMMIMMLLKQKCWWKKPWMCRGADICHDGSLHWNLNVEMTSTFLAEVASFTLSLSTCWHPCRDARNQLILSLLLHFSLPTNMSHPFFFRRQFFKRKPKIRLGHYMFPSIAFWVAEQNLR